MDSAVVTPGLMPSRPVRVSVPVATPERRLAPPVRLRRIAVVVPCFNRRDDAAALLSDLEQVETRWTASSGDGWQIDLRVLLVDNASTVPLSTLAAPDGVHLEHLRLTTNSGGSGGYNAGMRRVLALDEENEHATAWRSWDADYVWLVDSDARVAPDTLRSLLAVMDEDSSIVAAGSAICDPITGQAFELGGHVNRRIGHYEPMVIGNAGVHELIESDYVAACCALVRADAIRDTGVFPDRFLNGDDVEWFIRMKAMTGGRVVGVPWSHAMHPRFDRFPTWPRYYMTRNAFGPLDAVGGGSELRLIRALREVPRAVQQDVMGRRDLAKLHMAGLRHAARHRTIGPAPDGLIAVEHGLPLDKLSRTLLDLLGMARPRPTTGRVLCRLMVTDQQRRLIDAELMRAGVVVRRRGSRPTGLVRSCLGAMRRLVTGPDVDVAVVPARGRPDSWFLGRFMVEISAQGPGTFVIKQTPRLRTALRSCGTVLAGVWHAVRVARRGDEPAEPQRSGLLGAKTLDRVERTAIVRHVRERGGGLSMSAVILSYNRRDALERTLRALRDSGLFRLDAESEDAPFDVMVVDNASSDDSAAMVRSVFPLADVRVMETNIGVEAFNRGVAGCEQDVVLILDDDAVPEPRAVRRAMELLARRPRIGAVALHPKHPATGAGEWAAARHVAGRTTDSWPLMGCGNLVRRSAWERAGGYEAGFFLYRNDVDLALKLLDAGCGVHFNPAWVVWHDSPGGAGGRKSARWHRVATRNWMWMARRHGKGPSRLLGMVLGWAWAQRLAGLSLSRHAATLRGAWEGLASPAPKHQARSDGRAWGELLRVLVRR